MSSIELAPVEYVISPLGVLHQITLHPSDYQTLCGTIITDHFTSSATKPKADIICFTCVRERKQREDNVRLGNYMAIEGVDVCGHCNGRNWSQDFCTGCGAEWTSESRED